MPFSLHIFALRSHPEPHTMSMRGLLWAVSVSQTFLVPDDLDRGGEGWAGGPQTVIC